MHHAVAPCLRQRFPTCRRGRGGVGGQRKEGATIVRPEKVVYIERTVGICGQRVLHPRLPVSQPLLNQAFSAVSGSTSVLIVLLTQDVSRSLGLNSGHVLLSPRAVTYSSSLLSSKYRGSILLLECLFDEQHYFVNVL